MDPNHPKTLHHYLLSYGLSPGGFDILQEYGALLKRVKLTISIADCYLNLCELLACCCPSLFANGKNQTVCTLFNINTKTVSHCQIVDKNNYKVSVHLHHQSIN